MKRRLFFITSALSLLLCTATVILWAWSCHAPLDGYEFQHNGTRWRLRLAVGRVTIDNQPQRLWKQQGNDNAGTLLRMADDAREQKVFLQNRLSNPQLDPGKRQGMAAELAKASNMEAAARNSLDGILGPTVTHSISLVNAALVILSPAVVWGCLHLWRAGQKRRAKKRGAKKRGHSYFARSFP